MVWDLDGFRDLTGNAELAYAERHRSRSADLPRVRRMLIPAKAITVHDGIRVTTPTWTLGELGTTSDTDEVELAVECALHRGLTGEARLHAVLKARPAAQWPGTAALADALSRRRPGAPATESYAETRFLQTIVRPAGLEDPERQVPVHVRGRREPYRCDFVFRRAGRDLDVEIDGMETHGPAEARERDLRRDELVMEAGCGVRRFSASRIARYPDQILRALVTALTRLSTNVA
jgi:very-short-patch-repair endonuclease